MASVSCQARTLAGTTWLLSKGSKGGATAEGAGLHVPPGLGEGK